MATRVRLPAAQRREQIVEAVLRIIGERGVTSLTTATLAKAVGVTTGALFRHFDTVDEILREVVQHALRRIEGTFPDESLPPLQRVIELAGNRVRVLRSNPGLAWVLRSEQAYLTLPEDAVGQLRALVARSRRYLLDALRDGVAQGSIRADIEAEILLVLVMGTIHAVAGMPGIHRRSDGAKGPDAKKVFLALERLLVPPATVNSAPEAAKETKSKQIKK